MTARNNITTGWSKIGEFFANTRQHIYDIFSKMPENFVTIGGNILNGLKKGIMEKAQEVWNKVKEVAGSLASAAKSALKDKSPSRVFMEIGGYVMEGMAIGLEKKTPMVESAMDVMTKMVMKKVPDPDINIAVQDHLNRIAKDRAGMGFGMGGQMISVPRQETPRNLNVVLELDRMQLARAVYQLNNQETQRVGMRLAGGYA
jgi:phage-related protein